GCGDDLGSRGTAIVWGVKKNQAIGSSIHHALAVGSCLFSPDGSRLLVSSADGVARIWRIENGTAESLEMRHERGIRFSGFAEGGRLIWTASSDHTARFWDAKTGDPVSPALRHSGSSGEATHDERRHMLISVNQTEGSIRLWPIAAAEAPVEELVALSKILSGRTLEAYGTLAPITPAVQDALWQSWRGKSHTLSGYQGTNPKSN
ncbi:MAG: hypothetical protein ABI651_07625, partial [Verrucomicrobiota bacterium]